MARDFYINGECLVRVKGAAGSQIANVIDLGLTSEDVRVTPKFIHKDMRVNDFGPQTPPDVQTALADVTVTMTLIHFDQQILRACIQEALGGGTEGVMNGSMIPLGSGWPLFNANCHFISLNVLSPVGNVPWRFRASYMTGLPLEIPLGTKASVVQIAFRAIPYVPGTVPSTNPNIVNINSEIRAKGTVLWDHNSDA